MSQAVSYSLGLGSCLIDDVFHLTFTTVTHTFLSHQPHQLTHSALPILTAI